MTLFASFLSCCSCVPHACVFLHDFSQVCPGLKQHSSFFAFSVWGEGGLWNTERSGIYQVRLVLVYILHCLPFVCQGKDFVYDSKAGTNLHRITSNESHWMINCLAFIAIIIMLLTFFIWHKKIKHRRAWFMWVCIIIIIIMKNFNR